jgi:hypothetical protein
MDFPGDGTAADHAYWLSVIEVRDASSAAPLGSVDAISQGFGRGDPKPSATTHGAGALGEGTFGSIPFTSQGRTWGATPRTARADALSLTVRNIRDVTVHPQRAQITCGAAVRLDTDGPVTVHFDGCARIISVTRAGVTNSAATCATASGVRGVRVHARGHGLRIAVKRGAAGGATVDVLRQSRGRRVATGAHRVKRFRNLRRALTWRAKGARDGFYTVRVRLAGDVRSAVLERRAGRFHRRAADQRHPGCGKIRRFAAASPVSGGRSARRLRVRAVLAANRHGRIELRRGKRVVGRVRFTGSRTWSIRPAGRQRGVFALRVVTGRAHAIVHARRL